MDSRGAYFNGSSYLGTASKTVPANFSMSIWVRPISWGNATFFATCDSGGTNATIYGIYASAGSVNYYAGSAAHTSEVSGWSSNILTPELLTLETVVCNTSTPTLTGYRNGVQVASVTYGGGGASYPLAIGRLGAYAGYYFNGYLQDARIYDTSLSPNEVIDLYRRGPNDIYNVSRYHKSGIYLPALARNGGFGR
ncbi:LamG-like jellyroll fold domain-containing protein [Anaeroselena agilis]|uniref:LamG-like jellyroll fold domain-containing protein n=1 Tax=Anaeroselena agilis TaxID=3063788 RepID=UPI0039B6F5F2